MTLDGVLAIFSPKLLSSLRQCFTKCRSKQAYRTALARHVLTPETPKRNHRNETTETTGTAETTETPERNHRNTETKPPKHRNETTETTEKNYKNLNKTIATASIAPPLLNSGRIVMNNDLPNSFL